MKIEMIMDAMYQMDIQGHIPKKMYIPSSFHNFFAYCDQFVDVSNYEYPPIKVREENGEIGRFLGMRIIIDSAMNPKVFKINDTYLTYCSKCDTVGNPGGICKCGKKFITKGELVAEAL